MLATNTSTLDIDAIAAATARPESVVGLHFFSPAHVMRLRRNRARPRDQRTTVLATALAFAKRLGKVGVVVGNGPGFVGNRMMFPYMYEAQFLVEDGATPEQVDRVLTDWGMAMGIFAVDDMGGLDVAWRVRQELHQFEEPGARDTWRRTDLSRADSGGARLSAFRDSPAVVVVAGSRLSKDPHQGPGPRVSPDRVARHPTVLRCQAASCRCDCWARRGVRCRGVVIRQPWRMPTRRLARARRAW